MIFEWSEIGVKIQRLINLCQFTASSGARGLRRPAQPTTSTKARYLMNLDKPTTSNETRGLGDLDQPSPLSEVRGSRNLRNQSPLVKRQKFFIIKRLKTFNAIISIVVSLEVID